MATRAELEKYVNHPNVRKFLDLLSKTEGTTKHSYNTNFGGSYLSSLQDHPRVRRPFKDLNGKREVTTASGRYQFIAPTWDAQAKKLGLRDFGPLSQDLGALGIIADSKALNDIVNGNFTSAINKLGTQWASLPSSKVAQPKHSWASVNKYLGQPSQVSQAPQTLGASLAHIPASIQQAQADLAQDINIPDHNIQAQKKVPRETSEGLMTSLGTGSYSRETLGDTIAYPQRERKQKRQHINPYEEMQTLESTLQTEQEEPQRGFGIFVS